MYIDWRNSVDKLIADKLDEKRIRSLVLQSLEGPPKDTARLAYKNGKGGEASHAEADDPQVVQEDERLDNEVILQAKSMIARKVVFRNVADKHWIRVRKDDPVLHHVQDWLTWPKGDKQTLSGYLNGRVPDADRLAYSR